MLLKHQSVVDGIVCLLGVGLYVQPYMWMTGNDTFDQLLCKVWHGQALFWFFVVVSIWNLVLIAVERFLMIKHPYKHRNILPKHVYISFTALYILSLVYIFDLFLHVKYILWI